MHPSPDYRKNPTRRAFALIKWRVAALGICMALGGCDQPVANGPGSSAVDQDLNVRDIRAGQADFLNQIRQADPEFRTIERALLNEKNELGLVLDQSVELDKIPALMRLMLTKMAAQFPGQDLTVLAYTPSNPPRKLGTARLDARTRDMSYTVE